MRVLLAIPCLMRGGTEMQTLYLAKALVAAGHRVELVCYFEVEPSVADEFTGAGCRVELLRLERGMPRGEFIGTMKAFYRSARPDVLHVQYMTPGALAIIAAKLAGVPKVFATVHQPYTPGHGRTAFLFLRVSALLCDRFMAVSKVAETSWFGSSSDCLSGNAGFLSRHCTVHNAVDTRRVAALVSPELAPTFREKYRLGDGFVFGYVGRLSHEKGVDILFQAFGGIAASLESVRLLVVGSGVERERLEERFGNEPWWRRVVFAGTLGWEEAMKHLSVMDAVVVPSRFEGFGLSAVEAMAASKPVIAARTGGLVEIIEHGTSGLLYAPENVQELVECMFALLKDGNGGEKYSLNALRRASEFDVGIYNKKIQEVYNISKL
jgi:glycosyltransferase involved in cell wall biosynthesis